MTEVFSERGEKQREVVSSSCFSVLSTLKWTVDNVSLKPKEHTERHISFEEYKLVRSVRRTLHQVLENQGSG